MGKRKKICFITWNIFDLGGVQRVISVLASELSKQHDIDILCTKEKIKEDRALYNLNENINVIFRPDLMKYSMVGKVKNRILKKINNKYGVIENNAKLLKDSYYPRIIRKKCVNFINNNNYDIVIASESFFSMVLAIEKSKLNCKVIGWQHNSTYSYFNENNKYFWKRDLLFKKYIGNLDKYVVLTDKDKRELKEKFNIDSIRIYNPLSFQTDEKCTQENKQIISVGRLSIRQKGFDLLLQAFKKVYKNAPDWTLKIVGDGPDKPKIIEMIQKLGLEKSVFIESNISNVKKQYLQASIFVSASRWEGFGLVITEAMECGNVVVAFDNSGPREIITSWKDGILVERENVDEMADRILDLIENYELRSEISKQGIEKCKSFDVRKIAYEWNNIIEQI